jgi:transcriptional repressor NrdR
MRCPFCGSDDSRVVDSRDTDAGDAIRRRRECGACVRRYTTYERLDAMPLVVVKRDGRQEVFDRAKLLRGIVRACVKRDIPLDDLERVVDEIEDRLRRRPGGVFTSAEIGRQALRLLRDLDKVAYVRFASVYRQFDDVEEFKEELARLDQLAPELEGQELLVPEAAGDEPLPPLEVALVAAAGRR